jgi:hypothetical protein
MTRLITKTVGGLVAAATLATAATPADAQRYRRHYHRDNSGAIISAGIIGLGVGAAIASGSRSRYRDRYYYNDYYGRPYYDGYYGQGYGRGYRDNYRYHCATRRVWDPYWRRYVRVRYC